MQQSSNPHIDIYLVFSFLFYRWILLQIKLTTATSDLSLVIVYNPAVIRQRIHHYVWRGKRW